MSDTSLTLDSVLTAVPGAVEARDVNAAWVANLERLLHSADTECRWTDAGRVQLRTNVLNLVAQRLRADMILSNTPAIRQRPLPVRFAIAGLARSGTTLLHRLLACDPDVEYLPTWQAFNPVPAVSGPDKRLDANLEMIEQLVRTNPELLKQHPLDAYGAEEEIFLLQLSFASMLFAMNAPLPSFTRWLNAADHTDAYRFAFDLLRLNEWSTGTAEGRPRVMKSPQFLLDLAVLDNVVPDATIIQTHRDPADLVGSYCSIYASTRRVADANFAPGALGHERLGQLRLMIERSLEVRSVMSSDRVVDVHYARLVKEPLAVIDELYAAASLDFTSKAKQAMQQWISDHPQGHAGKHQYNLADYGLSRAEIDAAFASYLDRHPVERES